MFKYNYLYRSIFIYLRNDNFSIARGNGAGGRGQGAGGMEKEPIKSHEDLEVYKMAFDVAMKIFELSKKFPVEERYSLTDQIRRSSRSVCAFFS